MQKSAIWKGRLKSYEPLLTGGEGDKVGISRENPKSDPLKNPMGWIVDHHHITPLFRQNYVD